MLACLGSSQNPRFHLVSFAFAGRNPGRPVPGRETFSPEVGNATPATLWRLLPPKSIAFPGVIFAPEVGNATPVTLWRLRTPKFAKSIALRGVADEKKTVCKRLRRSVYNLGGTRQPSKSLFGGAW